ncbi:MAG: histidine kinase [Rhodothermales bacterium]|nr:histidine kinase [Rhodothermales bacterium]
MSKLSGKIGGLTAAVAFVILTALEVAGLGPGWAGVVVTSVVSGAAAYLVSYQTMARRIELARDTLREIRRRRFENLELAHAQKGDEINDLIWQVYRTGQVLESEFAELRKVESYRREFVGNVSHELKTPIFAIRGFAETLRDGALDDPSVNRGFTDKIIRNADRLSNLAQDLSEISRLETGEQKMEFEPFDMRRLVDDVLDSLEPIARERGVSLASSLADGLPPVRGDAGRIRQVLINLIDNAIKYSRDGGFVEVVARSTADDRVKLTVADNGIGIAEDDLPRLTERFFRVDKSRSRSAGGTGLGLSIVKHILAAHDAVLQVKSRAGAGSTFGFQLPVDEGGSDGGSDGESGEGPGAPD